MTDTTETPISVTGDEEINMTDRKVIATRYNDEPVYMPQVDDPATYGIGSDSYGYTVVEVSKSGKTIHVRRDKTIPGEGHNYYGHQVWQYFSNPHAQIQKFTLRKCGTYRETGSCCGWMTVGARRHYSDPHF